MKRFIPIAMSTILALTLTFSVAADTKIKIVRVIAGDGNVTVAGYDGDTVKNRNGSFPVPNMRKTADGIVTVQGGDRDVDILVPETVEIEVLASDGAITINGMRAPVSAKSEDGEVVISDMSCSVSAVSEDGDVSVSFCDGAEIAALHLMSEDGNVRVELPDDYGATLSIRVSEGSFLSDFEIIDLGKGASFSSSSDSFKATVKIGDGSGYGFIVAEDGNLSLIRK